MTIDQRQADIEERIAELDPRIELLAIEPAGRETLRLFVDHPDGVGLELCERVTHQLRELLADYALEVSSPGLDRPLAKREHFARFAGQRARVRLAEPLEGQRNFTGRILAPEPDAIALETDDGVVAFPLERVKRANLVPDPSEVQP